jgi:hypothetical protein
MGGDSKSTAPHTSSQAQPPYYSYHYPYEYTSQSSSYGQEMTTAATTTSSTGQPMVDYTYWGTNNYDKVDNYYSYGYHHGSDHYYYGSTTTTTSGPSVDLTSAVSYMSPPMTSASYGVANPSVVIASSAKVISAPAIKLHSDAAQSLPALKMAEAGATTTTTTTPTAGSTSTGGTTDTTVPPSSQPSKSKKKLLRSAGGQYWADETLAEWPESDFRIFVGDLGNECTDEMLARAFGVYPSFQKAHVVVDKHSQKTRGYGFVSFRDPHDYLKAMREMNGKYIGNRPVKLRKSTWNERNVDKKDLKRLKAEGLLLPRR